MRLFGSGICGLLLATGLAAADTFELRTGGALEGHLLNPDEKPRRHYLVATPQGAKLAIPAGQVKQHKPAQPLLVEYEQIRQAAPDTPDGHWRVVEWCQEHRLRSQMRSHLQRLVELDPEHGEARRMLGYQRVRDDWLTREELMTARGYILFEGDWRTPQDVEVRRREAARKQEEIDWKSKLKRWRSSLTGRNADRAREAKENILAASDPRAAKALVAMLERERNYEVRLLLLKALGGNTSSAAVQGLVHRAVLDDDAEMRASSIDYLMHHRENPHVIRQLVKALKSNANVEVNRAAVALGRLANPETVLPLIEALVTRHRVRAQGPPGEVNAGFSKTQGGGFSFGKGGPREVVVPVKNPEVLSALVAITQQSFSFDQRQWKGWYTSSKRVENVNLRRD